MLMAISGTAIRILTLNSTNLYKMKNIAIYIFTVICTVILASCSLEEMQSVDSSKDGAIEFIVRPTSFISHNVATKTTRAITTTQLTEAERKVISAYFLVFNSEGNRVICEKLNVAENTIPSKTLLSDYGADDVTVCFIANVPESFINGIQTIDDLSSKPLDLTYATYDQTGYIGIPVIDKQYCFPMFGMTSCSLKNAESQVVIDLKRLFAKVSVNINLNLSGSGELGDNDAYFDLKKLIIRNIPNKVKLTEGKTLDENKNVVLTESDWTADETSFEEDTEITCNTRILDDEDPTTGYKISFYVPEYVLLPDPDKQKEAEGETIEERERMKPTLVKEGTFSVSMTIKGDYFSVFDEQIDMTYDIFFGEDKYDSFSLIRNVMYANNITIRGASVADNRVEMKYAGFVVGFPHSVKMDAHFNVRPLRLKFTDDFISGMEQGLYTHGEIKIEVQRGEGQNTSWIALERPIESEISSGSVYAKGISGAYPTKRKYFTTGLISELDNRLINGEDDPTAGSSVTFRTDDPDAMSGKVITWVYIDEYDSSSADSYREATLAVTFTMDGSSEGVTKRYLVRQSAMYPMTIGRTSYGVELFEEYTMDYDSEAHYDSEEDLGFESTVDGFPWGLEGIELSRNKPALHSDEIDLKVDEPNTSDELSVFLNNGIKFDIPLVGSYNFDFLGTISTLLNDQFNTSLQSLDSYYDFYTSDDVGEDGILSDLLGTGESRDYEGFIMNVEIIHTLLQNYGSEASAKLNGMILDEDPLSAIAYCYNKNKRKANGEVISVISEKELDISNYHWYAPSIKELEDIIKNAYNNGSWLHEEFKPFADNMYWSCHPAYLNNDIELNYTATSNWTIKGYAKRFHRDPWTVTLTGAFIGSGSGEYLQEDAKRARATKFNSDTQETVGSYSKHKSKKLQLNGTYAQAHSHDSETGYLEAVKQSDFLNNISSSNYITLTGGYFISLYSYLSDVSWGTSGIKPEGDEELETPDRGEGNMTRTTRNRVRCVYYPHSYTKATRGEASEGSLLNYGKQGYTTSLSR